MVTNCKIFVSVFCPFALKLAIERTAEIFAINNTGPRPYSPASQTFNNRDTGHESLRQQLKCSSVIFDAGVARMASQSEKCLMLDGMLLKPEVNSFNSFSVS